MDYANQMQKCAFFESILFAEQILVNLRSSLNLKPVIEMLYAIEYCATWDDKSV